MCWNDSISQAAIWTRTSFDPKYRPQVDERSILDVKEDMPKRSDGRLQGWKFNGRNK